MMMMTSVMIMSVMAAMITLNETVYYLLTALIVQEREQCDESHSFRSCQTLVKICVNHVMSCQICLMLASPLMCQHSDIFAVPPPKKLKVFQYNTIQEDCAGCNLSFKCEACAE